MANFLIDSRPYSIEGLFHAQNCELKRENARLRSEIRALRELLQEIEAQNQFCTICGKWEGHKDGCVLKAELNKMEVGE